MPRTDNEIETAIGNATIDEAGHWARMLAYEKLMLGLLLDNRKYLKQIKEALEES
jgi:hypothetical protein